MPDPSELLATADLLCVGHAPPTNADLRRAVLRAYYALFHQLIRAAVERFIGLAQEHTAAYALLYRSFDHARMKEVCKNLDKEMLGEAFRRQLNRQSVSPGMRVVAKVFPELQALRHRADYDPTAMFDQSDVFDIIGSAASAMDAFKRSTSQDQTDVMALMMVG